MTTSDGRRFQMWQTRGGWVVQEYGEGGRVVQSEHPLPDASACDRVVHRWRKTSTPEPKP